MRGIHIRGFTLLIRDIRAGIHFRGANLVFFTNNRIDAINPII